MPIVKKAPGTMTREIKLEEPPPVQFLELNGRQDRS